MSRSCMLFCFILSVLISVIRWGVYVILWSFFRWLRKAITSFTLSLTIKSRPHTLHLIMCSSLDGIFFNYLVLFNHSQILNAFLLSCINIKDKAFIDLASFISLHLQKIPESVSFERHICGLSNCFFYADHAAFWSLRFLNCLDSSYYVSVWQQ